MRNKSLTPVSLLALFVSLIVILSSCGVNTETPLATEASDELNPQIVGGTVATPHEYPFMVHLGYRATSSWCGGSLIHPQWVLTAAHCLIGDRARDVVAVAGDHKVRTTGDGEQARRGSRIILHPNYSDNTANNDIALLKLDRPMTLNANVQVIGLADLPSAGSPLTVIGWGTTREGGSGSDVLREVEVPYQSDANCREAYGSDITASMFCAGLDEGGKDSCQGDSGGPIFRAISGQWKQVGIVSWGDGCARAYYYGVYTKAALYTAWINGYINSN